MFHVLGCAKAIDLGDNLIQLSDWHTSLKLETTVLRFQPLEIHSKRLFQPESRINNGDIVLPAATKESGFLLVVDDGRHLLIILGTE